MIYVPNSGPKNARIVFVGEAPGEQEERQRAPFVGQSGTVLRDNLTRAGISPESVRLMNVCHYRPPNNNIDKWIKHSRKKGAPPVQPNGLVLQGIVELFHELAEIKKQGGLYVIVPLGNTALYALTGNELISRRRESIYELLPNIALLQQMDQNQLAVVADALVTVQGTKVIPTFHPAFIGREMLMQPIFRLDLKRIANESKTRVVSIPTRNIIVDPDESTANEYAARLLQSSEYSMDIETPGGRLYCIGYSCDPCESIVLGTDSVWKMNLHRALATSNVPKVFQNGVYDCHFLLKEHQIQVQGYGYDWPNKQPLGFDTMFAQHAIYPEWRLGLDFLASIYTKEPYYKDEGKGHDLSEFDDTETYMRYCGKDACVTLEVAQAQRKELRDPHFRFHFDYIMSQVPLVVDIMARGIQLDVNELERLRTESEDTSRRMQPEFDVEVLHELINIAQTTRKPEVQAAAMEMAETIANNINKHNKQGTLVGGFNVMSSQLCQRYLYDIRGFKKIWKRNKNAESGESVTADEESIKELYGQSGDDKLLKLIKLREERKLQTSYLNVKHTPSGRTWFSINPVGTRSSRWSEAMTLTDYGFNFQTPPHKIRSIVVPDDGLVLFYIDLSQAEDRIVSYYANVTKKIEAFENGIDAHALTASLIFGLSIEEVIRIHKERKKIEGKDGPQRYLGKQSNHAFNYGEGAPTFTKKINKDADETGIRIELKQAKFIRNQHLLAYPEIQWYWQDIEAQLRKDRTLVAPRIGGEKLSWKRRFATGRLDDATFREAYSWIPQYCPPAIVNRAAVSIYHEVLPHAGDGRTRILNQVHDALLGQCLPDEANDIVPECIRRMSLPVEINGREIVIPVDAKIGPNWKELG